MITCLYNNMHSETDANIRQLGYQTIRKVEDLNSRSKIVPHTEFLLFST